MKKINVRREGERNSFRVSATTGAQASGENTHSWRGLTMLRAASLCRVKPRWSCHHWRPEGCRGRRRSHRRCREDEARQRLPPCSIVGCLFRPGFAWCPVACRSFYQAILEEVGLLRRWEQRRSCLSSWSRCYGCGGNAQRFTRNFLSFTMDLSIQKLYHSPQSQSCETIFGSLAFAIVAYLGSKGDLKPNISMLKSCQIADLQKYAVKCKKHAGRPKGVRVEIGPVVKQSARRNTVRRKR